MVALTQLVIFLFLVGAVRTTSKTLDYARQIGNDWTVPTFTIDDLKYGHRMTELASVLATTGLLSVEPHQDSRMLDFNVARSISLAGLCECATQMPDSFLQVEGTESVQLQDGCTTRTSFATATMGHTPLPIPDSLGKTCGVATVEAMDALRDHVDAVSVAFITALDHLLLNRRTTSFLLQNTNGLTYPTVDSIARASSNLEHFHVYTKDDGHSSHEDAQDISVPSLDWHTDAGLFLTFVPAYGCDESNDGSFFIQDAAGIPRRTIVPEGTIAVMLGAGAEHWLHANGLRATRHALQMESGTSRAWYGTSKYSHLAATSSSLSKTTKLVSVYLRSILSHCESFTHARFFPFP